MTTTAPSKMVTPTPSENCTACSNDWHVYSKKRGTSHCARCLIFWTKQRNHSKRQCLSRLVEYGQLALRKSQTGTFEKKQAILCSGNAQYSLGKKSIQKREMFSDFSDFSVQFDPEFSVIFNEFANFPKYSWNFTTLGQGNKVCGQAQVSICSTRLARSTSTVLLLDVAHQTRGARDSSRASPWQKLGARSTHRMHPVGGIKDRQPNSCWWKNWAEECGIEAKLNSNWKKILRTRNSQAITGRSQASTLCREAPRNIYMSSIRKTNGEKTRTPSINITLASTVK